MKITVSRQEIESLKNTFVGISTALKEDSSTALTQLKKELFENNKIVTVCPSLTGFTINIKEEYFVDYMTVYSKYASLLVDQGLTMVDTIMAFSAESTGLVAKYQEVE
jgi:hypothetical protein